MPYSVAAAAAEFVHGPLLDNPYRVGKPLRHELAGLHSARLATEWWIIYSIGDQVVTIETIQHRGTAYRHG
jgi:mRNA interferase RelE/StbE